MDQSEQQLSNFLQELPKKCLFLAFEDPFRRCVFNQGVVNPVTWNQPLSDWVGDHLGK